MAHKVQIGKWHFEIPVSLQEAELRVITLTTEIQDIDSQLSSHDMRRTHELRYHADRNYHAWRQGALHAKAAKTAELRYLKMWIKEQRVQNKAQTADIDFDNPRSLIVAAYLTLEDISDRGQLTREEINVLEVLRMYLEHR